MVVPRDNKGKFVSSTYNLEVENGKNDNSNAEQNNPDEIVAANKITQLAFGNGNAINLFDEMRTLFARMEQKQIDQAKLWQEQAKVFEKKQKEVKKLRPKLCDEKEKIEKARLADSTHGMDDDKLGKEDDWNLINGKEWKQFKLSVENIVQGLEKQQNNINKKNINCDKNAKEPPKIDKNIPTTQTFIPPSNQQSTYEIPSNGEKTAGNEHPLDRNMNEFVPVEGTPFLIGRGRMMNTSWTGNGSMQLNWNFFPSVKPKQISPKMNTAWNGTGSMQLNWNFFPSVKPKCNKEQVVWNPPRSFRIFTDFAKHDGPMIAKRTLEWNQPRCKEISRVEPLSEGEGM